MKLLSNALLAEQVAVSNKPCAKVQIQNYTRTEDTQTPRQFDFDWVKVLGSGESWESLCDCDSVWAAEAGVTATADTVWVKEGDASAKLVLPNTFQGLIASFDFDSPKDLTGYESLQFWIKSTGLVLGQVSFCFSSSPACASNNVYLPIIMPVNSENEITVSITGINQQLASVKSIGLYADNALTVGPTYYLDDIRVYGTPKYLGKKYMCCASDGSLVATDLTKTVRFATPITTTNYGALIGNPPTEDAYGIVTTFGDIAANPTSGEVIMVRGVKTGLSPPGIQPPRPAYYTTCTIYYKVSVDYGVTWGSWTSLGAITHLDYPLSTGWIHWDSVDVSICFNSAGVPLITVLAVDLWNYGLTDLKAYTKKRIDSTWDTSWGIHRLDEPRDKTTKEPSFFTLRNYAGGTVYRPIYIKGMDVVYDQDWICIVHLYQIGSSYDYSRKDGLMCYVFGDGHNTSQYSWEFIGHVNTTNAQSTSFAVKDISPITSYVDSDVMNMIARTFQTDRENVVLNDKLELYPGLLKITDLPLILSSANGNITYLFQHRPDIDSTEGIFNKGFKLVRPYNDALNLCANSTYIFANDERILYMCAIPTPWVAPTTAGVAGSYNEKTSSRIWKIEENVPRELFQPATLKITFDNYDGHFDSPGAGDVAYLKKGSRLNLFLGYTIATVDTFNEYQRYFIDHWDYSREPNRLWFILYCVDAWQLLEDYKFPRPVSLNEYADTYTAYQIMQFMAQTIGGTLSTEILSTNFVKTWYPKIVVNTGESAANLLRRLLTETGTVIKWMGNEGTLIYPESTNSAVYHYQFPS